MRTIPRFYVRLFMFSLMCALIIYVMHFILPGGPDNAIPGIALNPLAQVGLFVILSLGAALIGFWIVFGDIFRSQEK